MANELNRLPTSLEPIAEVSLGDRKFPAEVTAVWFKFFTSVSQLMDNLVGGVLGFTLNNAVNAAGATQATATPLTAEWNVVTTTPLGSGVMVKNFGPGAATTVFNRGANPLIVYPTVGGQMDALPINSGYVLAANKTQVFSQIGPAKWSSMQLG